MVCYQQVGLAITIDIAHSQRNWPRPARTVAHCRLESSVTITQQHTHRAIRVVVAISGIVIGHEQVGLAILVHVAHSYRIGIQSARAVGDHRLKAPVTLAQKHGHATARAGTVGTKVGHEQIEFSVPVDVAYSDSIRVLPARVEADWAQEGAVSIPEQKAHAASRVITVTHIDIAD